jgi:hypothetical protein
LTITNKTPTEPKTALAGVMLEISFARFRPSIATFNAEMAPSRPFCCWDVVAIVENLLLRESGAEDRM